ncbi:MAG: hypothetical protein IPM35_34560 [Myxococcales bacterium]|nr:hypothetical protein [Myxococcales bacterium]
MKADALFKEGRALMKSGNFETACPKLEESYRLDPAAGTGINLGDCFEKQGKVASALLAYQAARALLKPGDPRIGPVEKEIAALDKRAPRLTIKLAPGAPDGTTVKRDGREVEASKLGVPVAVNPGKLKVVVSAPGRGSASFRVTLVEGQTRELVVEPGEQTSGQQEPTGRVSTTRTPTNHHVGESSPPIAGYVLMGVGAVGLAVGIYTGREAQERLDRVKKNCPRKVCRNQEDVDAADEGRALNTLSYVGWTVGIVGLASSASYFLFFSVPSDGTGAAVGAAVAPGSGSVVLKGRF